MTTALTTLIGKMAERLGMGDSADLVNVLKATCFKGQTQVTDAQMTALMVVANQYGLNPWTKEIYAFPDKGGIVPVVGVDGWSRIINNHPQFDGMDFEQDEEKCTCIMFRKDRSHPIKITEYMSECRRASAQPWQSHPRRMLRHKAMIQCARIAFGFSGIYDQDEAERIVEVSGYVDAGTGEISQGLPAYSDADFAKNLEKWRGLLAAGMDVARLIQGIEKKSRALLTDEQKQTLAESPEIVTDVTPKGEPPMSASEQEAHDAFVAEMGAN